MSLIKHIFFYTIFSGCAILSSSCSNTAKNINKISSQTRIQIANNLYESGQFDSSITAYNNAFLIWQKENKVDSLLRYSLQYAVAFERVQHVKDAYPFFNDLEHRLKLLSSFDTSSYISFLIGKSIILYNDNKTYESILALHHAESMTLTKYKYPDVNISKIYDYLGVAYSQNRDYKKSLEYNLKSAQCSQELKGDKYVDYKYVIGNIAAGYFELGIYDLAEKYSNELIRIITNKENVDNSSDLLQYYLSRNQEFKILKGNYSDAISTLQIQLENCKKNNNKQSENLTYELLTKCYNKMGIPDSAIYYSSQLYRSLRETTEEQFHPAILDAAILNAESLSNAGQTQEAFKYLRIADANSKHLSNLGSDSYLNLQYRKALIYLKSDKLDQIGINMLDSLSSVYSHKDFIQTDKFGQTNKDIANWYYDHKEWNKAENHFKLTINALIKTRGENNPDVLLSCARLLSIYTHRNKMDEAALLIESLKHSSNKINTIEGVQLALALARFTEKKYYLKKANKNDVIAAYKRFDQVYEKLITNYSGYFNPSTLGLYNCADGLKDAAFFLANIFITTNKKEYLKKSFFYSEKYRQTGFRLSIQSKLIKQFSNYPTAMFKKEKELLNNISFYKNMISGKPKDKYYDVVTIEWEKELNKYQSSYDSLIIVIKKQYPDYYDLKFKPFSIEIDTLLVKFTTNKAICTYLIRNNEYIEYIIAHGQIHLLKERIPEQTIAIVNQGYNIHNMLSPAKFTGISYQIYDCFFRPSEKYLQNINQLSIAPDLQLSNISFDNLVNDTLKYSNLFDRFNISYTLSASSLLNTRERTYTTADHFFAPIFKAGTTADSLLLPQPFIEKLGLYLRKKFGFKEWMNEQATEENFRKHVSNNNILFIGSHIDINTSDGLESKIYLNPIKKRADNDGQLKVKEIYGTKIESNLLILAGCESGKEGIGMGPGLTSLATAFTYAGSPNMLVSLWPVDEDATATLCKSFIRFLASGNTPTDALYLAKKQFIREANPTYKSPFYWSGFVLIGQNNLAIVLKSGNNTIPILFWCGILLLSSALFILGNRARKKL